MMKPYKKLEDKKWTFSFFLGKEHRKLLKDEADRIDASQAFVLRQAIDAFFKKKVKHG